MEALIEFFRHQRAVMDAWGFLIGTAALAGAFFWWIAGLLADRLACYGKEPEV
jgi:hypothetical protein